MYEEKIIYKHITYQIDLNSTKNKNIYNLSIRVKIVNTKIWIG